MPISPSWGQINNPEINIFSPEAVTNLANINNLEKDLGVNFHSYKWYLDWDNSLERVIPDHFHSFGKLPELAWQPQVNGQCVSFNDVLNKKYDPYITSFAQGVKKLGYTIRINLAPEMNASWESWGVGNCGNEADNTKAFWQYVVTKFRSLEVTNVQWVWTPNIHFWGEKYSYSDLFPGDDYVDFLGLDGYNWGTSQSWSKWQSFREIFESSYHDLTALSGKKILIMETASTEDGGNKADWIKEMFKELGNFPQIQGITWFNINKETDWRINSSNSSKDAFSQSVQGDFTSLYSLDSNTDPLEQNIIQNNQITQNDESSDPQQKSSIPEKTSTPQIIDKKPIFSNEKLCYQASLINNHQQTDSNISSQLILNLKITVILLLSSMCFFILAAIKELFLILKKSK